MHFEHINIEESCSSNLITLYTTTNGRKQCYQHDSIGASLYNGHTEMQKTEKGIIF